MKFIGIIQDRLFPALPADLPRENPLFIYNGPSVDWMPSWVGSSIGNAVSKIRTFGLSEELNMIAFWTRNLSRLVMFLVFCIAALKFLNK
ncbi:MAG: hypothetical protein HPZ91_00630 [Lentisphaeria bacterium]|nr:hypothetical protein [Lentisphaeria bacterium]